MSVFWTDILLYFCKCMYKYMYIYIYIRYELRRRHSQSDGSSMRQGEFNAKPSQAPAFSVHICRFPISGGAIHCNVEVLQFQTLAGVFFLSFPVETPHHPATCHIHGKHNRGIITLLNVANMPVFPNAEEVLLAKPRKCSLLRWKKGIYFIHIDTLQTFILP